ncbi:hypothetical protein CDAR_250711 [Caerostris darwini]|uniref:Uncharacterized protein n=1 Tax=Caerostris darwini TaxID=1538125 RepID=A0AAV4RWI3_9ARAC|nr:hypothetical protein CDAR_250711 [Caerostris darwini]
MHRNLTIANHSSPPPCPPLGFRRFNPPILDLKDKGGHRTLVHAVFSLCLFEKGRTYPPFTPVCSGDLARCVHPAKLLTVSSSSNDRSGANIDHSGLKPLSEWGGDGRTSLKIQQIAAK